MTTTTALLNAIQDADQDFEWYPTTAKMIDAVAKRIPGTGISLMDVGAGDGRVLVELGKRCKAESLYAIEKSPILVQAQPEEVTPVGTDLFEQNLTCLPVDYIFCNPPYSQYETWASVVIESGYAKKSFLIVPRRWKDSEAIAHSLKKRGATARVVHSDDFHDAERRARAVVDIVEISYPRGDDYYEKVKDPFDIWFDQNIDTFEHEEEDIPEYQQEERDLAKVRHLTDIGDMVAGYNEEYARMEENYRAIFRLDYALLKELSVSKDTVREGIKKKMAGLKNKYWHLLFERLDTVTSRLSTKTKAGFLEKLTGRAAIAFTTSNAYAVVLWAIKHANKYYDEQLVTLFRDLSTFEGVMNYKSNQRAWEKDGWRYAKEGHDHYALDYRIVVHKYSAIFPGGFGHYEYPGDLHKVCHEMIDDVIAVFHNLGFATAAVTSRSRHWSPGRWHDFHLADGRVLFQAKAHKNGNLHFRFLPDAIRVLNVEAGRLLGWLRSADDVVSELGYGREEAAAFFGSNRQIAPSNVRLLAAAG